MMAGPCCTSRNKNKAGWSNSCIKPVKKMSGIDIWPECIYISFFYLEQIASKNRADSLSSQLQTKVSHNNTVFVL